MLCVNLYLSGKVEVVIWVNFCFVNPALFFFFGHSGAVEQDVNTTLTYYHYVDMANKGAANSGRHKIEFKFTGVILDT